MHTKQTASRRISAVTPMLVLPLILATMTFLTASSSSAAEKPRLTPKIVQNALEMMVAPENKFDSLVLKRHTKTGGSYRSKVQIKVRMIKQSSKKACISRFGVKVLPRGVVYREQPAIRLQRLSFTRGCPTLGRVSIVGLHNAENWELSKS